MRAAERGARIKTYKEPLEAVAQAFEALFAHGCSETARLDENGLPPRAPAEHGAVAVGVLKHLGRALPRRLAIVPPALFPARALVVRLGRLAVRVRAGEAVELAAGKVVQRADLRVVGQRARDG